MHNLPRIFYNTDHCVDDGVNNCQNNLNYDKIHTKDEVSAIKGGQDQSSGGVEQRR